MFIVLIIAGLSLIPPLSDFLRGRSGTAGAKPNTFMESADVVDGRGYVRSEISLRVSVGGEEFGPGANVKEPVTLYSDFLTKSKVKGIAVTYELLSLKYAAGAVSPPTVDEG